jgi:hypothetical protein
LALPTEKVLIIGLPINHVYIEKKQITSALFLNSAGSENIRWGVLTRDTRRRAVIILAAVQLQVATHCYYF